MATAARVLVGITVLPNNNGSAVFDSCRIDEAKPRKDITLVFSLKEVSHSAKLGLRGEFKREHADARSDAQHHRILANIMRAGGWRIFNNSRRNCKYK